MLADWSEVLVSWVPFVVLILVWVLLSRRMRAPLGQMNKYYDEMQRMNALLDRIAAALEKRAGTSA